MEDNLMIFKDTIAVLFMALGPSWAGRASWHGWQPSPTALWL